MVYFRLISFLRKNLDGANVEIKNNKNNLFFKNFKNSLNEMCEIVFSR